MDLLNDKTATLQVLGCILQSPILLSETEKYRLNIDDFDSRLTKGIFGAIYNLYQAGAESLSEVDIDMYLSSRKNIYQEFMMHNGIELLQDAKELSQLGNFPYYYSRVKKFSALRALKKNGFNIDDIYDTSFIGTEKMQDQDKKLDDMSIQQIFQTIQQKYIVVEQSFTNGNGEGSASASTGLKELKEQLKLTPEVGRGLQNEIFSTVTRGARRGTFYLDSGGTGAGKSRKMVGHACYLAFPYRYNSKMGKWECTNNCEPTLIITTELTKKEIQTLVLASVSGINEEIILYGKYTQKEEKIVDLAIQIIEHYQNNLYIEQISNPTRTAVVSCIRRHNILYNSQYVFYDYIFSSPGLLNEYRDLKIREDVVLMMLSTSLKDVAVELDIFVWSATQLSGDFEQKQGVRNQSLLRGAKSIADKADVGTITSPVTLEEITLLTPFLTKEGLLPPTHVIDVYKVRGGRYTSVKIWGVHDLGICRIDDLFITNAQSIPIDNFHIVRSVAGDSTIPNLEDILGKDCEKIVCISAIEEEKVVEDIQVPKVESDYAEIVKSKLEPKSLDWSELVSL